MLDEKLQDAKRSSMHTWILAGIFVLAGFSCGLLLYWMAGDASPPPSVAQAPAAVSPQTMPETIPVGTSREDFKQALKAYEAEIDPIVGDAGFGLWNPAMAQEIARLKANALDDFSLGLYDDALHNLTQARRGAERESAARAQALSQLRSQAAEALARDDADAARLHLAEALRLAPDDSEFLAMADQAERLPKVLDFIKAADIAKAENRPEQEIANLEQALALAPDRPGLADRAVDLHERLGRTAFSRAIAQGVAAVENGDVAAARQALGNAQSLDPQHSDAIALAAQLTRLERQLALRQALGAAQAAQDRDAWGEALGEFTRAASLDPNNAKAVAGRDQARRIVAADNGLDQYLSQPHRLASPDIAQQAKAALAEAWELAPASTNLTAKTDRLGDLVAAYGRDVMVRVVSDGQTQVVVRGIGKVGMVQEKTISLKPGDYVFEGLRPGFRSKLVKASVPPDARDFTIRVICDDPI